MRVTFTISNEPILTLNVDMATKRVTTEHCDDPRIVDPIILPEERTYDGLTRRLKFLMSDKPDDRSLPELLTDLKVNGIAVPWQYNLNVSVSE